MPESNAPSSRQDLQLLRVTAEEAGRIAMRYFGGAPEVWLKAGDSPVSEADLAVNRFLRNELLAARPDYEWLSEEDADGHVGIGKVPTFVVDPIDGTRAFIGGQDTWCISIAVVHEGRPVAGILNCPAMNEIYVATRGGGASLNDVAIKVGIASEMLEIAGPGHLLRRAPADLRQRFRVRPYIPSLAYRIAMVASGELDATLVKRNARDWDVAAADLIIEEAGGAILDPYGRRLLYCGHDHRHGEMVAGSGALLSRLSELLLVEE